ncbi:histidine kinase [Lacinutrix sp. 5H-3-7-4]|uniref:tetratricopeptide repeat-containing sensor histidine kinase n=1 Tax=Lacinutrix sp. (strain 5H-3-7-4) TaxID=983544 RepID=UPI00020A3733|nr:histidine kinase [Lacinutrix sp. 5H-3-7-4]AEH01251.1 putative signal transduction histidine kinase [Lacinutrix sp. 5H-3-7-4]
MIKYIQGIVFLLSLILSPFAVAQTKSSDAFTNKSQQFTIRGTVKESDTKRPIKNVSIQVNGGKYTFTNTEGAFRVEAKIGDELIVNHKDFHTIYYTIERDENIDVEVEPNINSVQSKKYRKNTTFGSLIDSAKFYKRKSAEKSIQFVSESIKNSTSAKENAEAFETLGDINMYWKQYDLAISNYKISLNSDQNNGVKLKLANAYKANKEYQNSLLVIQGLKLSDLSNYQTVAYYEALGDTNRALKKYNSSIEFYKTGLEVAKQYLISSKITDLNSKLAQTYNDNGAKTEAKSYYQNALSLAAKENKSRAIKEKIKVADFNNSNAEYEEEIVLRKEAIPQIEAIETDSLIENESDITVQKQNYKIGTAYYLQKDYNKAIPFLEKSVEEASKRKDLVVEKDGNRKLYEVYKSAGDFEKARIAFDEYAKSLEKLYIEKEQQITQIARFNKNIAEKQNRIISLENDRELSQSKYQLTTERNKNQKIIIYSLVGGLLLLSLVAYLMYKSIKQQKLANNLLALKSLRSQMNPHFIFNALNSVNGFIAINDERTANKYLSDFSKLMRAVLENSEEDFIPLQKEIELIELYTKLEHSRFKNKFDYNITVDKAINLDHYKIPPMLLQPYIENAVWHGLRYKETKGVLDISITKTGANQITISIIDNGIGREKSKALKTANQKKQNSKGMGNIKKRVFILNNMYKDKVDVFIDNFKNTGDTGTKVVVTLKRD